MNLSRSTAHKLAESLVESAAVGAPGAANVTSWYQDTAYVRPFFTVIHNMLWIRT
jgi:hypothetical protein